MVLLIPVDKRDIKDAKIVTFDKKVAWMVVEMNQGFVENHTFVDGKEDIRELIEYVIIKNSDEDVEEFLNEGIEVLVAPLQIYAGDVIEAYKFRELHEL